MPLSEELLEIIDYKKNGYSPVIDYGNWRVAVLNYSKELRAENLTAMQRHNETDEVFVLLRGHCILFLGEGDGSITEVHAENMEPFKIYNVKKAACIPIHCPKKPWFSLWKTEIRRMITLRFVPLPKRSVNGS